MGIWAAEAALVDHLCRATPGRRKKETRPHNSCGAALSLPLSKRRTITLGESLPIVKTKFLQIDPSVRAHLRLVQTKERGHLARFFPTRANARQK